jgi:hypothetical protein
MTNEQMTAIRRLATTVYDYQNQAWVENGRYVTCSHPAAMDCGCYGRLHAGEVALLEEENRRGY